MANSACSQAVWSTVELLSFPLTTRRERADVLVFAKYPLAINPETCVATVETDR